MKKESKFEVGDRVSFYVGSEPTIGVVIDKASDQYLVRAPTYSCASFWCYAKQLRKLVKKKRRGWWILKVYAVSTQVFNTTYRGHIATDTKPDDTTGWIYVEERKAR